MRNGNQLFSLIVAMFAMILYPQMMLADDTPSMVTIDGEEYYQIGTAAHLEWFRAKASTATYTSKTKYNAVLTADITINADLLQTLDNGGTPESTWGGINDFFGTIDGQGHTISGMYAPTGASNNSKFGMVTTNYGVIRNLGIVDSYFGNGASGSSYAASFAANNSGTITDCYSTAKINAKATSGGIAAANANSASVISNCYFAGTLTCTDQYSSPISMEITGGTVSNCYYIPSSATSKMIITRPISVTATEMASGKVAVLLQDGRTEKVWGQSLGKDIYPTLLAAAVYATHYNCDGTLADDTKFSNTASTPVKDAHIFDSEHTFAAVAPKCTVDGNVAYKVCKTCGAYFLTDGTETTASAVVVAKTGHSFGSDGKCTNCGEMATVTVDKDNAVLAVDAKLILTTTSNASSSEITWSSSNPDVATVDNNGKVIAKTAGVADITATVKGTQVSATCTVTVGSVPTFNIPSHGTNNITISADTQCKIYDDGGDADYYSNDCNGKINITAPSGYAIKVTGKIISEDTDNGRDILTIGSTKYCGNQSIDMVTNNPSTISFTSNETDTDEGFELTVTTVPFINNITYKAEKQSNGKYNVQFSFTNDTKSTTYTVKEGAIVKGTIKGTASLNLKDEEAGIHTYTFLSDDYSVDIKCSFGAMLMPVTGSTSYALQVGETIKIYDDGGDDIYSNGCDGTVNLTAPTGYAIKVTGTYTTDDHYDKLKIGTKTYNGENPEISQFINNPGVIGFTSDSGNAFDGFELAVTAVPFLSNIKCTADEQSDYTYNVNFTFDNKHASTTYTVKEGNTEKGTINGGATSFQVKGEDIGSHTFTITDGETSIDITCEFGTILMPADGSTDYALKNGEKIRVYDDGGADDDYGCDRTGIINFTAPENSFIKITGTCQVDSYNDYLSIDGKKYTNKGTDAKGNVLPVSIDYTTSGNKCTLKFISNGSITYSGFDLIVTVGIPTGIQYVTAEESGIESLTYNALGQRVNADARGFVIKNGRKFYNK